MEQGEKHELRRRGSGLTVGIRSACTIVARNYLAQAAVLFESFHRVHPEVQFTTLVVDANASDRDFTGVGRVVRPADLRIPPATLRSMIAIYDVMELATALKPLLLQKLLAEGSSSAAYFDPDILFYDRIDETWEGAESAGVALTPHVLAPFPADGLQIREQDVMLAGIFNLGFIAVSPAAVDVLTWWGDRLRTQAISDPTAALFTDQRWIDWVPAFMTPYVSRDPGQNVAHWNLHERPVMKAGDSWTVAGVPLRFFHFSGHDPATPWVLTKHAADRPRTVFSDNPQLTAVFADYDTRLEAARTRYPADQPYGHRRLSTGLRPDAGIRRFFRKLLIGEVPSPTRPSLEPAWWAMPQFGTAAAPLTAMELSLWHARLDLQAAFPEPLGRDAADYRSWAAADPETILRREQSGVPESPVEMALLPLGGDEGVWRLLTASAPGTDARETVELVADTVRTDGRIVVVVDVGPIRDLEHARLTASALTVPGPMVLDLGQDAAGSLGFPLPDAEIVAAIARGVREPVGDSANVLASAREIWALSSVAAGVAVARGHADVRVLRLPIPPRARGRSEGIVQFGCDARLGDEQVVWAALDAYVEAIPVTLLGARLNVDVTGLPVLGRERILHLAAERADVVVVDDLPGIDCYLDLRVPMSFSVRPLSFAVSGAAVVVADHPANRDYLSTLAADFIPIGDDGEVDHGHVVRVIRAILDHPGRVARSANATRERIRGLAALAGSPGRARVDYADED